MSMLESTYLRLLKRHSETRQKEIDNVNAYLIKTLKLFCRQNFHDGNFRSTKSSILLSSSHNLQVRCDIK